MNNFEIDVELKFFQLDRAFIFHALAAAFSNIFGSFSFIANR